MNEGHRLLQAILDDPENDALRLVYADWLDEQGAPRGEFIRVQVLLAGLPKDDPRYRGLWKRELELIRTHKEEWFGSYRSRFSYYEPRRGFIDEIYSDTDALLAFGDRVFADHPLRHLLLSFRDDQLPVLAAYPHFGRLATLRMTNGTATAPGQTVEELIAGFPFLANLQLLEVRRSNYRQREQQGRQVDQVVRYQCGKRIAPPSTPGE